MRKKKSEGVSERPDLLQVRTRFDYRDGKWHRVWYNRNGIVKEEIIDADLYLLPNKGNFTTEQLKRIGKKLKLNDAYGELEMHQVDAPI